MTHYVAVCPLGSWATRMCQINAITGPAYRGDFYFRDYREWARTELSFKAGSG